MGTGMLVYLWAPPMIACATGEGGGGDVEALGLAAGLVGYFRSTLTYFPARVGGVFELGEELIEVLPRELPLERCGSALPVILEIE